MSMNFRVSGQGIEVTNALNEYTLKKFSNIEKHFNNIVSLNVTLKKAEGEKHRVSADIHLAPKKYFHADVKEEDMYQAIDQLSKVVTSAVDKHHHKKIARNLNNPDQLI